MNFVTFTKYTLIDKPIDGQTLFRYMSIGEGSHGRNQFEFNYKNARREQWTVDMGVGAVAVMVGWQRTHLPSYPFVVVP